MILFIPTFQYYLKTGTCKFGATCKFHHPRDKAGIAGRVALNILGYPLRPVRVYSSLTCVWLIGFWHIIVLSCLIFFFLVSILNVQNHVHLCYSIYTVLGAHTGTIIFISYDELFFSFFLSCPYICWWK